MEPVPENMHSSSYPASFSAMSRYKTIALQDNGRRSKRTQRARPPGPALVTATKPDVPHTTIASRAPLGNGYGGAALCSRAPVGL
jgi:hypothetical protein